MATKSDVKNNQFQNVYVKPESGAAWAAGDTNFTTSGIQIRTRELVSLEPFTQVLIADKTVRTGWADVGAKPAEGLKTAEDVVLPFALSPATVSGDCIKEDNLSKFLTWIYGERTCPAAIKCSGGCTNVTLACSAAHGFTVHQVIKVGSVRSAVKTVSGNYLTLAIPLATAASSGDTITPCEQFDVDTTSGVNPICCAIVGNDTELSYNGQGGMISNTELTAFKNGEVIEIKAKLSFANWDREAVSAASTAAESDAVVVGVAGDGLLMLDASGDRYNPICNELSAQIGIGHEWTEDIGSTNGKAGFSSIPVDSNAEMTVYQDGTQSKLEALVGIKIPILMDSGKAGIYFPNAYIAEYPVPIDIGTQHGVKCKFTCGAGYIYRSA